MRDSFPRLESEIVSCELCPRLREWCLSVALKRRRAFRDETYWGRPVPGFGDPHAQLLVLGLAPGAHGANRTGRVFTGDPSGDWLFRAMHDAGFASQPTSAHRQDGLALLNAWVSASVRCAPPDNKPSTAEIAACRPFFERELDLLSNLRCIVALGRLAFDNYLSVLRARGLDTPRSAFPFAHLAEFHPAPGTPVLLASYHPSQQNTSTRRLTRDMLAAVFHRAAEIIRE
jgi:uracil-DNA glycosylase family 4